MARAARATAAPARAAGDCRRWHRHPKAASSRAAGVTSANRRGRDCARHAHDAHGDEITRAVQARRKPFNFLRSRCLRSRCCELAACDLAPRIFSTAISGCLARNRGGGSVGSFGVWAESQHKSESFAARALVRSCGLLTFRYLGVDKVYSFIHQSEERETARGVPGFARCLAAHSSVYSRTQPNAALVLTH